MIQAITTDEAIKVIDKYPTIEDYVKDNYDAEYEGRWIDNVAQLEEYYQECESIVKEYLHNTHG